MKTVNLSKYVHVLYHTHEKLCPLTFSEPDISYKCSQSVKDMLYSGKDVQFRLIGGLDPWAAEDDFNPSTKVIQVDGKNFIDFTKCVTPTLISNKMKFSGNCEIWVDMTNSALEFRCISHHDAPVICQNDYPECLQEYATDRDGKTIFVAIGGSKADINIGKTDVQYDAAKNRMYQLVSCESTEKYCIEIIDVKNLCVQYTRNLKGEDLISCPLLRTAIVETVQVHCEKGTTFKIGVNGTHSENFSGVATFDEQYAEGDSPFHYCLKDFGKGHTIFPGRILLSRACNAFIHVEGSEYGSFIVSFKVNCNVMVTPSCNCLASRFTTLDEPVVGPVKR